MMRNVRSRAFVLLVGLTLPITVHSQPAPIETDWYEPSAPHLKLNVAEDGIYRVNMNDLGAFIPAGSVTSSSLRLLSHGEEIPIDYHGSNGQVGIDDYFYFVGQRNTGSDEAWAYNYNTDWQVDDGSSLFTDTTTYFLTWGGADGMRYVDSAPSFQNPDTVETGLVKTADRRNQFYNFGQPGESGHPIYTKGEGWMWQLVSHKDASQEEYIPRVQVRALPRTRADSMHFEVTLVGGSASTHVTELWIRLAFNEDNQLSYGRLDSLTWDGYKIVKLSADVPQSMVRPGGIRVSIRSLNESGEIPNRFYIHHVEGEYSAFLSPDEGPLEFAADRSGQLFYQFISDREGEMIVLKPESGFRFQIASDGSFSDNTSLGDRFWVSHLDDVMSPTIVADEPSNLADPNLAYDYVIIAGPSLLESAQDLKAYRESVEGGGFHVLVASIQDVFDQFDFGRASPIAMRRFIDYSRSWNTVPGFFTFWGDALYPDPDRGRFPWEVPSFGNTSGDGWFAMGRGGNPQDFTESVAVGRIPVRTNELGSQFVEKLRDYEKAPPGPWEKQITLMAGGTTALEQSLLHGATQQWGKLVADGSFGGDVTYFLKSESTALDPTFLDSVDAAIARGTSWLAFFGHSAADSWEIVTTPPTSFDNAEHLPMAVSLGCFTGAFARGNGQESDGPVYAELLVTESRNGAIAHFGGSASSLISSASLLANELYDEVFEEDVRVIGEAVRMAKQRFLALSGSGFAAVETPLQYNLIGDPATRLVLPTKPDFSLEQRSVSITPIAPVAGFDSVLTVGVEIENRGKLPPDSVTLKLTHTSALNVVTEQSARLAPFPLVTKHDFKVPFGPNDLGEHRFEVVVDPLQEYDEVSELNNRVETSQTIFASGVIQLFPQDFGLVTSRQPMLQIGAASTSGEEISVEIELDTVATFDSPHLLRDQITLRSVAGWTPPTLLSNGHSYYWRVRVDDPTTETVWSTASFTVREDLPASGWLQQGSQFAGNTHGKFLDYANGRWSFKQFTVELILRSGVRFGVSLANSISVAGVQYNRGQEGFGVVILDSRGNVKDGAFGSFVVYPQRDSIYVPEIEMARLDSLISTAQIGDYVLINTLLARPTADAEGILPEAIELFKSLGSKSIENVGFYDMWNFVKRIGAPAPLLDEWVKYVPDVSELNLTNEIDLHVSFGSSDTRSPLIGPATFWNRVQWSALIPARGSFVEVSVLSTDGDTLATSHLGEPGGTQMIDLSSGPYQIDADTHPFIQLAALLSDTSLTETPQLVNWYVGYESVPELSLIASGLQSDPDTLAEGDPYTAGVTVVNAAGATVDSVFVKYEVTDATNTTSLSAVDTLLGMTPNSTLESSAEIATFGLLGRNRVTVTVSQPDPREPIPYNNTAFGYFFVLGDNVPPDFRVTVDGVEYPSDPRVINSTDDPTLPFLGAKPLFEVTLTDENLNRPLQDSVVITMLLDGKRVPYGRPDVVFEPGDEDKNEARLTFSPDFTGEDTTHTLKIYAQDLAGNANPSKENPYTFSFRVQTEAEVENLYPYPNPMNNFTTFMFKLRGADPSLVEDMRIRIYTISGQIVREFDLVNDPFNLEGGGLQIGWNRLRWDGTDEDGDLLANGVYLYKVYLRAEGKDMSVNNETSIEKIAIVR